MKELMVNQESFVSDRIPTRLKNLATHLQQIGSLSSDATQKTATANLIRENLYFIEWTAPDMEIDPASELVELGRTLARWSFHWEKIWCDADARTQVSREANSLSQQVLKMSGLLGA